MKKKILHELETRFPNIEWEVAKLRKGEYAITWTDGISAKQINTALMPLINQSPEIHQISYWRGFSQSIGRLLFNALIGLSQNVSNPLQFLSEDFDRIVWSVDVTDDNFLNVYKNLERD